jgi:hypothetical protein
MKLYFSGSFSVGKSTVKRQISKDFNLLALPEIFRTLIAERDNVSLKDVRSNIELAEELQREVLIRQFYEERTLFSRAAQEGKKGIVACRGIDSIAFMIHLCRPAFIEDAQKQAWFKDYIDWLKTEDSYHFLLHPSKDLLVDDGFRDTNWDFSLEVNSTIKTLFRLYGIKYTSIRDTNMSERISLVERVLKP